MRRSIKFRLIFLVSAIISYTLGFQLLPENLDGTNSHLYVLVFSILYFLVLPITYWYCIIKMGEQKLWKMLLIFSMSSLMTRLSFPAEIASYFEFIAWLRYPIIAILLAIELYLMVSIIKALWLARNLSGDPRVHILDSFQEEDDKKRSLALVLASEPASWYYAIPRLSRNHVDAITKLKLRSAARWHWLVMTLGALVMAALAYVIISPWSELLAIIVSSITGYGVIMLAANYRISRYFSIYGHQDKLVINNSVWGFISIKLEDIESVEVGRYPRKNDKEGLHFGYGDSSNIKLRFSKPQTYFGGLGQLTERVDIIDMHVSEPQVLADYIQEYSENIFVKDALVSQNQDREPASDNCDFPVQANSGMNQ
ncbi:hypothetical protein FM037_25375 [Shewanella psychropiezotolerans]|uniref:Uncharacterized protein n=1 Tax=Shewanella psychropiezotolerans TaxID=2593655 RepID=A0ABX5X3P0_9GAMM|nr:MULTISPECIES: hypothetical protein [Shewanella]MPY25477.1 hypothetical protein [Shewanella sp. YLB-07]QDO85977.1 hypothetical protein FM037_25375 [Shewanella psychropiezotolerans]